MEVRLLGPVELVAHDRVIGLGPQLRVLLAALAVEVGNVVPSTRLIELLWEDELRDGAATTLRAHVCRLRGKLLQAASSGTCGDVLTCVCPGYRLDLRSDRVDSVRFERLASTGFESLAAGNPDRAANQLRTALGLWRGQTLAAVADRAFAVGEAGRLERLRVAAQQGRIEADLARGRHAEVVGELEGLVAESPLDEGLRLLLVLALYRSGRAADAAQACQKGLSLLAAEGLASPALQARQRDVLLCAAELDDGGWRR